MIEVGKKKKNKNEKGRQKRERENERDPLKALCCIPSPDAAVGLHHDRS